MTRKTQPIDRRQMLVGAATASLGAVTAGLAGCDRSSQSSVTPQAVRRDVPLRVVFCGTDEESQIITRGWGAVSEVPLQLEPIALNRAATTDFDARLLAATAACDVVIYPLALVPEMVAKELVVPFSDKDVEAIDQAAGPLVPALRNGAARYAGEVYAVPLGGAVPALLASESLPEIANWSDYDQYINQVWKGAASEPTAPGWAALSFLHRAATATSWLFQRETMKPLLTEAHYVKSLELMIQTCQRYTAKDQSPQDVFEGVAGGPLEGGIGFPLIRNKVYEEIDLAEIPAPESYQKVLLDPYSPLISIASNCRQSATAKRFVSWFSGGEGSERVRQQIAGMTRVRLEDPNIGVTDSTSTEPSFYDRWLEGYLSAPVTLPTLQLLQSGMYYQSLDEQVRRALDGQATASEALGEVAKKWQQITEDVGVDKQRRAWRRAQGMRA